MFICRSLTTLTSVCHLTPLMSFIKFTSLRRWRYIVSLLATVFSLSRCVPLSFTLKHTCTCTRSSDYNTLLSPADMSDCNEIPGQGRVVYLRLVLNVSPASSDAVTLLRCLGSSGRYSQISHTSITRHPQLDRPHAHTHTHWISPCFICNTKK